MNKSQDIRHMVCGFVFDANRKSVVLLYKTSGPLAVLNRWNGVGGKVEGDETSRYAMQREFAEEAGVETRLEDWVPFMSLTDGIHFKVHFFYLVDEEIFNRSRQNEEEAVGKFLVERLPTVIPNLRWIIPMALCHYDYAGGEPEYLVTENAL